MKMNEALSNELTLIKDAKIKEFTAKCLSEAPEYLCEIPTSSTGKYHPPQCNVKGGFIVHIRRTIHFACLAFESYGWLKQPDKDIKMDLIIAALLLHDIGKKDQYKEYWEYYNHPIVASKMIEKNKDMIDPVCFKAINDMVLYHMGAFTPKSIKKEIEKYTLSQLIVYQSDFLASRKDIIWDGYR